MLSEIGSGHGWGCHQEVSELVNDADGPAFPERELMGLGMDGYHMSEFLTVQSGLMPTYVSRASDLSPM